MEQEATFRDHLDAVRRAVAETQDIEELMKLEDSLRDVLIEIYPFLINTEKRAGRRSRMIRDFQNVCAERHGVY